MPFAAAIGVQTAVARGELAQSAEGVAGGVGTLLMTGVAPVFPKLVVGKEAVTISKAFSVELKVKVWGTPATTGLPTRLKLHDKMS